MHTTSASLLFTLLVLGAACSSSTDDHGLASARSRWTSHHPSSYSFTRMQFCECLAGLARPIRITVTSGQITSAVFVDDQTPVGEPIHGTLQTIDAVFDKIEDALDQSADEVTVAYDPARGYPTSVFIDYSRQIADEEFDLRISDFAPNAD